MVVFFDIDGTLVDYKTQIIPESTVRAVRKLIAIVAEVAAQRIGDHENPGRLLSNLKGFGFSVFQLAELAARSAVDHDFFGGMVFGIDLGFCEDANEAFGS